MDEGGCWRVYGEGKEIIHVPEDKCISALASFSALTFSPSLSPSLFILCSSVHPYYSCFLPLCCCLTGWDGMTFCHGVWNTSDITCQLRDNNGWHEVDTGKARCSTSTQFHLCPNSIKWSLDFIFFLTVGSKSVSVVNVSLQGAKDANSLKSVILKSNKCILYYSALNSSKSLLDQVHL